MERDKGSKFRTHQSSIIEGRSNKFPFQQMQVAAKQPLFSGKKSRDPQGRKKKQTLTLTGQVPAECLEILPKYFTMMLKNLKYQTDCYTTTMTYDLAATTDGAGLLALVFGSNPSNGSNWSNAATFFDEYRTLGMQLEFEPLYVSGGSTATIFASIITVIDYDSSATMSTYSIATQYSSVLEFPGNKHWKRIALMSGVENSVYTSTASPVNQYYIKLFSSGNTFSATIGRFKLTYLVQFRGKGI